MLYAKKHKLVLMQNRSSHIQVICSNPRASRGQLQAGDLLVPCALGRSGLTNTKREGDGATPTGTWPLRELFYRADRLAPPVSALTRSVIEMHDGWCDDPVNARYNTPVRLPFSGSHEKLWREDNVYDIIVPLGFNDDPPVCGLGSAIFFHLASEDYRPTEGCVAISMEDMQKILPLCGPDTVMMI
jgi:L,D-peptidoglycan transpeptidase YkuD (ErfK/YbiS/YcfS/YnhG family)